MSAREIVGILDRMFGCVLPLRFDSPRARQQLVTISGQEATFKHRWQVVDANRPNVRGPARGLWQFELGTRVSRGGVWGVFLHESSRGLLQDACEAEGVAFVPRSIWLALAENDTLACAVARLLLLTDPRPLPLIGDEDDAWAYYLRNWRPGAHTNGSPAARTHLRAKWTGYYAEARAALA